MENGLDSGAFDALLAIESSEHMPDLGMFFAEVARALRPGGRLVVWAWLTRPRPWERRWLLDPICREGRLRGMESAGALLRHCRTAGLVALGFRDVGRQVKRTCPT
jgi:tocopherol O-methyltransferase